ncbi:MAG TPA: hypothetical protein VE821_01480 [Pyrinomonadaceae bacterium]|nr:hypothetical protein [Pyrinomonadaceae bacterium]
MNSTSEGATNQTSGDAEITGTWALQVSSPFGVQPITFTVERAGGALNGVMRHERGAADVSEIHVRGQGFSARAAITLKGMRITADIEGRIEGAQINGTVNVHLPLAPVVKFTGVKQ